MEICVFTAFHLVVSLEILSSRFVNRVLCGVKLVSVNYGFSLDDFSIFADDFKS